MAGDGANRVAGYAGMSGACNMAGHVESIMSIATGSGPVPRR